jgi:hypothetical protein
MKRCKHITCWTDYPFVELGDEPYKLAPIRHVNIISYDGNKYAKVSFENCGDILEVKIGYLYSQPGRYGQVKRVNPRKIERMGDGKEARRSGFPLMTTKKIGLKSIVSELLEWKHIKRG